MRRNYSSSNSNKLSSGILNVSVGLVTVTVFLLTIGAIGDVMPWINKGIATTKVTRSIEKPTAGIQSESQKTTANYQGAQGQANKDLETSGQLR